jgi:hypothetical protein
MWTSFNLYAAFCHRFERSSGARSGHNNVGGRWFRRFYLSRTLRKVLLTSSLHQLACLTTCRIELADKF